MHWTIAQARQRFSEVVKQATQEPQIIHNRHCPVVALISAADYAAFEAWRRTQTRPRTLADDFAERRALLLEAGLEDGLDLPPRTDRPNAFVALLEEDYGELSD